MLCEQITMKIKKLWIHKQGNDKHDILLNPKEFPEIVVGDVVEIYHPEEEYSRMLLQITYLSEDTQAKENVVSIEQSVATAFNLKMYKNVIVNKVDKQQVTLDLVEVLFKDQYYSRSDMHRMRNSCVGACVYLNKKIDFSEMRVSINELWCKGEKVTCGVISEDTKIVFRSTTAVVQIFIQMSSEMWEFDINGDLYFEKAVNGFLTDLYAKWKEQNCLHDVTIVMFSRTFYEAQSRDEFPQWMQDCLQKDHRGRFYEDFYRIVVQNERYEEWTDTIKQLRKIFYEYPKRVLNYHRRHGYKVPKAYNSTAAEGNFLETLNMTLNLFEKYYLDRNFDRTGKVAVVITPGAGVFEVDRELTNITKQRTIDCGVGSDLVCMGEQPLHAAPLFKFHSKNQKILAEVGDDYNIPHWMNHSFYTSKNQIQFYSNKTFVPRIKIPLEIFDKKKIKDTVVEQDLSYNGDDDNFPFVDYDEYDAQVFKLPNRNTVLTRFEKPVLRRSRINEQYEHETLLEAKLHHIPRTRHISDDISLLPVEKSTKDPITSSSLALSIPSQSSSGDDITSSHGSFPGFGKKSFRGLNDQDTDRYIGTRPVVGSAGSPVGHRKFLHNYKRYRALINPFAPSRMQFKMTSNRRRWVHAFPTDPHGVAVQTHHVHTYSYNGDNDNTDDDDDDDDTCEPTPQVIMAAELAVKARQEQGKKHFNDSLSNGKNSLDNRTSKTSSYDGQSSIHSFHRETKQLRSSVWGPTGEQEWSPELTTGLDWRPLDDIETIRDESRLIKPILAGYFQNTQNFCAGISVDWKSLTMPASLPITTDYFPDHISLQNDYVVSDYSLLPEDVNSDFYLNPPRNDDEQYYRKQPLILKEVFRELISQRLAQGFQLITVSKVTGLPQILGTSHTSQRYVLGSSPQLSHMSGGLMRSRPREEKEEEVYLSIGRIFHKLTLSGPTIIVTRYRPRHPNPQMCYSYRYRFQAPDSFNYDVSWSEFRNEKLENYNWNYLDQYICTRGEGDFGLMESLKFWRSRFYILPCNNPATKKIIDGHDRCDIYEERNTSELKHLVVGFTRYLETLNKIRRTASTRQVSCKHTEFLEKNPNGIPQPDTRPEAEVLTVNSSSEKIVQWMLDEQCGIPMLPKQQGLPERCFISAEVVDWCYYHVKGVKGVKSAMIMLQRVLDDGCIIHASGSTKHKMIYGFYIYTIISKDKSLADQGLSHNPLFQNDWCEVAFVAVEDVDTTLVKFSLETEEDCNMKGPIVPRDDWRVETGLYKSGQTWGQQSATLIQKYVNVDVDPQNKGDRPEWATARYHAYYSPFCAFELQVQWMVSTGCILGDLISNWGRKAAVCGFHLLPVPIDPFALPTAPDSDPLRGPIFIPLNIGCLEPSGALFQEYDQDTQQLKFLQLQEAIIRRFGFMASSVSSTSQSSSMSGYNNEEHHQYVHCTGGMYVIIEDTHIPSTTTTSQRSSSSNLGHVNSYKTVDEYRQFGSLTKKSSAEMRKDYIARQTSETFRTTSELDFEVGYLWSWNFMSSKRWRSANTGDEHFQDKVLSDFRSFCSNEENRLLDFWIQYKENCYY